MIIKLKKLFFDKTKKSMMINLIIKPLSMIVSFVYVPVLLSYLGNERYGLWATLLSLISWINYCDIGIGNGLRNILTKELTLRDREGAKKSVSTAYFIISIISFILLLILIILVFVLNWYSIFNTAINMTSVIMISFIFICINFVLGLGNTILYALQISEKIALLNLIASLINLIGVFVLHKYTNGNLIYIAILFGISTSIVYIYNNICIFHKYSFMRPSMHSINLDKAKGLCGLGLMFFVLQIAGLIMNTTDNIVVTRLFGAQEVTPFNTVYKMFNALQSVYLALIIPIWSRVTQAIAQNDIKWVKSSLMKLNKLLLCFTPVFIILIFIYKPLAFIWLKKELNYPYGLITITALCSLSEITSNTYSQLLNGMNCIRFQMIVGIAQAIINIPLSVYLGMNCGMGSVGVKLATLILMLFSAVSYGIYIHTVIRRKLVITKK